MNVKIVETAGILKSRTLHMANTKPSKYSRMIHDVHNKWCYDNGYPMRSYKPGPGRPKLQAPSLKRQAARASGGKPQAPSYKRQAPSRKPQAA